MVSFVLKFEVADFLTYIFPNHPTLPLELSILGPLSREKLPRQKSGAILNLFMLQKMVLKTLHLPN